MLSEPAAPQPNQRTLSRQAVVTVGLSALAVFALALVSPAIFNDSDTYWHIRAGQWMIAHRAVLTTDPFSLSFAGRPWQTQEWLAEIGLAGAFGVFGWSGVAILTGIAIAAATAVLGLFLARRLDPFPGVVVLTLALGCVMPNFLARPHILALPCLVIWTAGLAKAAETQRRPSWALLLAMLLWVNLHGSFMFGLALIVPFAIEAALADPSRPVRVGGRWLLFAIAAVAVCFLNPRGLAGVVFPIRLIGLKSLASVGEWQSPDFHAVGPVEIAVFAAVFFFLWRGIRISAVRLVVLLGLTFLWLQHARYGMLLGMCGAALIAAPLSRAMKPNDAPASFANAKLAIAALAAVLVVLAAMRVAWPARRTDASAEALAAVPASVASLPVFNNYAFGGLLIFEGIRPLVDSRADLYGDAFLGQYARAIDAHAETVNKVFRDYRVAWAMLEPNDPLVGALDRRPGWRRIYADAHTVVQAGPQALAVWNSERRMSSALRPHLRRPQT